MNVHLMFRDRDFDLKQPLPANEAALTQDLELDTLFRAMARGDDFLFHVARQALLGSLHNDTATVLHRQAILQDCLRHPAVVQKLYETAVEAIEGKRSQWLGIFSRYPSGVLHGATELMRMLTGQLAKLRLVADEHARDFGSAGFRTLFMQLQAELSDDYLAEIHGHLEELRLDRGVLVSAELGAGNAGVRYVLRQSADRRPGWIHRLLAFRPSPLTYRIGDRDEAGARALGEMQDQGINLVANALAQSADHILGFFVLLRTELAFYLGAVNLHRELGRKGVPMCFPVPAAPGSRHHSAADLRDACLVLNVEHPVVGNDLGADGRNLVVITGANQGGKSTFLRGVGVAQLMMQSGLFVAAGSFAADLCRSLFTHYQREEDVAMQSGKFDEELRRMSDIVDALTPDALLLFNESFAATNEREGSEVARQIVHALLETPVKIFFVTHQYEFAHGLWAEKRADALFLRAARQPDGRRTFKLTPGGPLQTSFGADLYAKVFASGTLPQS
jgi:hypothetical protein